MKLLLYPYGNIGINEKKEKYAGLLKDYQICMKIEKYDDVELKFMLLFM